jgi:hypothetical protein
MYYCAVVGQSEWIVFDRGAPERPATMVEGLPVTDSEQLVFVEPVPDGGGGRRGLFRRGGQSRTSATIAKQIRYDEADHYLLYLSFPRRPGSLSECGVPLPDGGRVVTEARDDATVTLPLDTSARDVVLFAMDALTTLCDPPPQDAWRTCEADTRLIR